MCRAEFDAPLYNCRLIIERVPHSGDAIVTNFITTNVSSIAEGFGIDIQSIAPGSTRLVADIHFDIEAGEELNDVLRDLGLPVVHYSD